MVAVGPLKFTNADTALGKLARDYMGAMLARERNRAHDLIMAALEGGTSLPDIYLGVFQPVQYEIGWLWQTGEISVGHEHYCTNATQLIMSQLYSRVFTGTPGDKRVVAACAQGELHELGMRMLTDFFEIAGWDTYYLGANTPTESIVSTLDETRADLLLIGATIHDRLPVVRDLIAAVRHSSSVGTTPILVGGYTFGAVPDLWKKVGADGMARDATSAIELGTELASKRKS